MSKISEAFDNLIDVIEKETVRKIAALEEKVKEKRIEQLEKDLAELRKREVSKQREDYKEFTPVKE